VPLAPLAVVQGGPPGRAPVAARTPVARASKAAPTRLAARGGTPAVALLADGGSGSHVANTGNGMACSSHFRAGSVTKSFIATVVPQLADEHRPSPSDSVDGPPPGLARGAGDDGHRVTPRSPHHHTGGLRDFTRTTRGAAPVTPPQSPRIALTRPPLIHGRHACSNTHDVSLRAVAEQAPALEPAPLAAEFRPRTP